VHGASRAATLDASHDGAGRAAHHLDAASHRKPSFNLSLLTFDLSQRTGERERALDMLVGLEHRTDSAFEGAVGWERVPPEVLQRIALVLGPSRELFLLSAVCRSWRAIMADSTFYRHCRRTWLRSAAPRAYTDNSSSSSNDGDNDHEDDDDEQLIRNVTAELARPWTKCNLALLLAHRPRRAILWSARRDMDVAMRLLGERHSGVFQRHGLAAALEAAANGSVRVLFCLASLGVNLSQSVCLPLSEHTSVATTPLQRAVECRQLASVRALLELGVELRTADTPGSLSLLALACQQGNEAIVAELLRDRRCDVHEADSLHGWQAVHMAARSGHHHLLELLLSRGCEVDALDYDAWTPMHHAAYRSHSSTIATLHRLGSTAASTNAFNAAHNDGDGSWHLAPTPLQLLAETEHHDSAAATVAALVAAGASLDTPGLDDGWTALHQASYRGHAALVEALLLNGAAVDSGLGTTWTPLVCSARNGHSECVKLLLAHNASALAQDPLSGWRAIDYAMAESHTAVVQLLGRCCSCGSPPSTPTGERACWSTV